MQVHFVRHGESVANADGWIAGQLDPPLTDRGEKEAKDIARQVADLEFNTLIASTQTRARSTARIIAENISFEGQLIESDTCREWNVGLVAGKPKGTLRKVPFASVLRVLGGESPKQLQQRAERFKEELSQYEGPVLVVSHNAFMRTMRFVVERKPGWSSLWDVPTFGNCEILTLDL